MIEEKGVLIVQWTKVSVGVGASGRQYAVVSCDARGSVVVSENIVLGRLDP